MIKHENWRRLYKARWNGVIIKESMGHPAKFARGLIERIYKLALEEGWVKPGDNVIDPFGGIGLGALDAITSGLNWTGIEIEPRFCVLASSGTCDGKTSTVDTGMDISGWYIVYANDAYPEMEIFLAADENEYYDTPGANGFGSRELAEKYALLIEEPDEEEMPDYEIRFIKIPKVRIIPALCGKKTDHDPHYIKGNFELWNDKLRPWVKDLGQARMINGDSRKLMSYLGGGEMVGGVDSVLTSPPFQSNSADGGWQMLGKYAEKGQLTVKQVGGDPTKSYPSWNADRDTSYGHSEGQIADMPVGDIDAAISSPPYASARIDGEGDEGSSGLRDENGEFLRGPEGWEKRKEMGGRYGNTPGNIAGLPEGEFDLGVGSPPYPIATEGQGLNVNKPESFRGVLKDGTLSMGETSGNIGDMPIGEFDLGVSSPPWAQTGVPNHEGQTDTLKGKLVGGGEGFLHKEYGDSDGQISTLPDVGFDAAIASPPFLAQSGGTNPMKEGTLSDPRLLDRHSAGNAAAHGYGVLSGNLANLPEGEIPGQADAIISSPPYGDTAQSGGRKGLIEHGTGLTQGERAFDEYGSAEGQLGRMGVDGYDAAVSSPPFEGVTSDHPSESIVAGGLKMGASSMGNGYGEMAGNIGNDYGETFWSASKIILAQLFMVLKPGGRAIFVTKRYVKNKKLVPFTKQWAKLCMSIGFIPTHWIRAWVVEELGIQYDMFGAPKRILRERKSFFRRMAERKGSPRIDWEDVVVLIRPYLWQCECGRMMHEFRDECECGKQRREYSRI